MILDTLLNIERYRGLSDGFAKAVDFLLRGDILQTPIGTFEIDGRDVYGFVKETQLTEENTRWEAHERYADIQLILSGGERMAYVPFSDQPVETPYNSEKDCVFYRDGKGIECTLRAGDFMIFLPGELHRPDCPTEEGTLSRKMVLKVAMK